MKRKLEDAASIQERPSEKDYIRINRENQEKEAILNSIQGGIAVIRHTSDGAILPEFLSEGFAEMTGMSMDEVWDLYRQDAMEGVHPGDAVRLSRELKEFFDSGEECTELTYRLKKGDHSYIWVKNSMTTVKDENGVRRVYCTFHDLTREMEEHEKLRRQYREQLERHYRTTGPNVLLVGHCCISRNKVMEMIDYSGAGLTDGIGMRRDLLISRLSKLIVNEEERQAFHRSFCNDALIRIFQEGKEELTRVCFIKLPKDETGRYARFTTRLLEDPDTEELIGSITIKDMTQQVVHEKTMLKLAAVNYDQVSEIDIYKNTQTIIPDWKSGVFNGQVFEYDKHLKEALDNYVLEEDREKLSLLFDKTALLKRLEQENSFSIMYSVKNAKNQVRIKNLNISAIDVKLGKVCFARTDITDTLEAERKNQEALKQALHEAEVASRAKSDFLSSMSHDIRTPMNAIIGMTELAKENAEDKERLMDCLNKISLASDHLLSLVNDILDMNKIEESKLTLNREELWLPEILGRVNSILMPQAMSKGITFAVEDHTEHHGFYGDSLRINQILINLIGNALKFTPEGGRVKLVAEENTEGFTGRVGYRFVVRDTGVGMTAEFLQHVFEPFARSETASNVEGSGLGLGITKGLVDLMGGEIAIDSEPGKGTSVRVELTFEAIVDRVEKKKPDHEGEPNGEPEFDGYCFLAVEDNEINSEILCELLRRSGARVVAVENGKLAVEEFKNAPVGTYDEILMDIQMPVMNGLEATRTIRAMEREDAKTIPIIAMTANAFAEDRLKCLEAGMNEHVGKPINPAKLKQVIRRFLPSVPSGTFLLS